MNKTNSYVRRTGNASHTRLRSFLSVTSALLAICAVAGPSSPAFASPGDGTVDVTTDASLVLPGDLVTYTITLQNGDQAGLVTVDDNLPSHSTLVDAPGCTSNNGG